jgi:hypothetical protein
VNGIRGVAQRLERDIKRAVTRLIKAEISDSWKGGGDPSDIPDIERELAEARAHSRNTMARIAPAINRAITDAKASS